MSKESLLGKPYLVNFWGSWCVTCRAEHPVVTELARLNTVYIVGMNFRDESADATAWLKRWGNPYDVSLIDFDGRVSIDFGVYAAPETFLVDPSGTIVFKHLGQLTWEVVENEILPRVANMGQAADEIRKIIYFGFDFNPVCFYSRPERARAGTHGI